MNIKIKGKLKAYTKGKEYTVKNITDDSEYEQKIGELVYRTFGDFSGGEIVLKTDEDNYNPITLSNHQCVFKRNRFSGLYYVDEGNEPFNGYAVCFITNNTPFLVEVSDNSVPLTTTKYGIINKNGSGVVIKLNFWTTTDRDSPDPDNFCLEILDYENNRINLGATITFKEI